MPKLSVIMPSTRLSTGKAVELLKEHTQDWELVLLSEPNGFNTKLNKGVAMASGDYLIFLHDDAEVTPGWVDVLPGENEVGAFCLGENNDTFDTWGGFVDPPSYCTDPSESPTYSYWLCMHRDVIPYVFPLDERFENPMYQDVDMGLTIKAAGYDIQCLPGKIIHRNGEGSGAPDERQRGYLNRKWSICL